MISTFNLRLARTKDGLHIPPTLAFVEVEQNVCEPKKPMEIIHLLILCICSAALLGGIEFLLSLLLKTAPFLCHYGENTKYTIPPICTGDTIERDIRKTA